MKDPVTLAVRDRVAHLTLNRPEAGNALNPAVIHAFRDAAESLTERDDVGAVLFTGAGKNFSVGGDLRFMHDAERRRRRRRLRPREHDARGARRAGRRSTRP